MQGPASPRECSPGSCPRQRKSGSANLSFAWTAEGDIYDGVVSPRVKYLYCPSCKQLHVKPWFAIRDRCQGCFGEATAISIPANWMTYAKYVLYVVIPALVAVDLLNNDQNFLYLAVALLLVMFVIAYMDIARGEKYARERIKVTSTDIDSFRKSGRR